jgi:ABC-type Mn2+/Zn2+ transport system permease subunit
MMGTLREILAPDFLLKDALFTVVLVGFICPLVGVFFVLRRMVFLGVALPQISSTGVALALSLHVWLGEHGHGNHNTSTAVAFSGALVFSIFGVIALALLEQRRRGTADGWLGAGFVFATAASLLLIAKCPDAEQGWLDLFRGEVIAISRNELQWTAGLLAIAVVTLFFCRRELLLVSFDWRLARSLGMTLFGWDLLLFSIIGLTVAATVMTVGPLISFGFLLVPNLIARNLARRLPTAIVIASLLGGGCAFAGFAAAYRWDLPVGPAAVALLALTWSLSRIARLLLPMR